jgi:hypothetical protein
MKGRIPFDINLQQKPSGDQYFNAAPKQHAVLKGQVFQHRGAKRPPVAARFYE